MHEKWEKNPQYPSTMGKCDDCGAYGVVKLAWDLRRNICLDAKDCIARTSHQRLRHAEIKIEATKEDVVTESKEFSFKVSSKTQTFVCEICNKEWERPSTRGRPPKICPECR